MKFLILIHVCGHFDVDLKIKLKYLRIFFSNKNLFKKISKKFDLFKKTFFKKYGMVRFFLRSKRFFGNSLNKCEINILNIQYVKSIQKF